MSSENEKQGRQVAEAALLDEFTSRWFYVYRFRGHNDPVLSYRLRRNNSIGLAEVPREIDDIYANINGYPAFGDSMGDIAWRHKAYIVILLEDAVQQITDVEFTRRPAGINNSFLGGAALASVAGNANVSGFYCVNFMAARAGGDLGAHEAEVFHVMLRHRSRAGGPSILGHEDSGTNLGPPKA